MDGLAELVPLALILAPVAAVPVAAYCERMLRRRHARHRAERIRKFVGEPERTFEPAMSDDGRQLVLEGRLRALDGEGIAMSWLPATQDGPEQALHAATSGPWVLEAGRCTVRLDGPLAVVVGAHETAATTPFVGALRWARLDAPTTAALLGDETDGQARAVRDGDRVVVRGVFQAEVAGREDASSYRVRGVHPRLIAIDKAIEVAFSAAPEVAIRPAIVRTARLTIALALAFAVVPAIIVLYLQWRTLRADESAKRACLTKLQATHTEHRPWDATDPAKTCGTPEERSEIAWHNGELLRAARRFRQTRDDEADASDAAAQIVAGRYVEASRIVQRLGDAKPEQRRALNCLADGVWLMAELDDTVLASLRRRAREEQQQQLKPSACSTMLADITGEVDVLKPQIDSITYGKPRPPYSPDTMLAVLLYAEQHGGVDSVPLRHYLLDSYPPALIENDPRVWALEQPIALTTRILRDTTSIDIGGRKVIAALSARKALLDAYLGERELALAALTPVLQLAENSGAINAQTFLIGATAATLADAPGPAARLLKAGRNAHWEFIHRWAILGDTPNRFEPTVAAGVDAFVQRLREGNASEVHVALQAADGAFVDDEQPLRDWVERDFYPLCHRCGLRALAEHIGARRLTARLVGAHELETRLTDPARRVHAAMLRRDIAVPLFLLEQIVDR